jgi:hypothetical protein
MTKFEPRYPFRAYDYIVITDLVKGPQPGNAASIGPVFQVMEEPVPFFDYCNYIVPASGKQVLNLNANSTTVGNYTLHTPNLETNRDELLQYRIGVDSADIAVQLSIGGSDMLYVGGNWTYITPYSSPVEGGSPYFFAYQKRYPKVTITNTNPSIPVAALGTNQGLQVWGWKYRIEEVPSDLASSVIAKGIFSTVTAVPSGGGKA